MLLLAAFSLHDAHLVLLTRIGWRMGNVIIRMHDT
jgi:hypothetical protein